MKNIRLSIMVAVLLLGTLAIVIFQEREPSYQGRSLTKWISAGKLAHDKFMSKPNANIGKLESDPDWQCARHAIKQMAPRAIPFLLNWAQETDSPRKVRVIIFFEEHPHCHIKIQPAEDRNDAAQLGFMLLGDEAKPAWPVLIRWIYDTDRQHRLCALSCLARSKPDKQTLAPVLLHLIHNPDNIVQLAASRLMNDLSPQAAVMAVAYGKVLTVKNSPSTQTTADQTFAIANPFAKMNPILKMANPSLTGSGKQSSNGDVPHGEPHNILPAPSRPILGT